MPTSLTFCVAANNSPAPAPQTLTVTSNSTNPLGYNANAFPNGIELNGATSPPGVTGSTSANPTVTVSILPSFYASAGSSASGTIQVNSLNANSINIPVTVNITASCTATTTVTANPTSVNLTSTQASQQVTVTGPANSSIVATANFGTGPAGWFTINQNPFTAGSTVTISLVNASITPGTSGTITFTQNGTNNSVTIPVSFQTTGVVIASPTTVSLTPTQQSQQLTLTGPSGSTIVPTISYGNGPSNWFAINTQNQISFPSGSTITVFLNTTNLTSGTAGSITFTQSGTSNSVNVPVMFTTSTTNNQLFQVNPNSVSQTFPTNSSTASTTTIQVTGVPTQVTTSVNSGTFPLGGLSASPPSGPVPTNFTVTINPINFSPGVIYTGSVTVTQLNTTNSVTIPVSASVGSGAYSFSPNPLVFSIAGGTITPQSQTLTVNGPNNTQIGLTASVNNGNYQWLTVNGSTFSSGFLTNNTLQQTITVNASNLPSGQTFTGAITVTQNGVTVLTIPVSVTTTGNPMLTITPAQLNFAWQIGTTAPFGQNISVTTPTGTVLNLTATPSQTNCGSNWLVVSPTFTTNTPANISVSINTAGLPTSGTVVCNGNIQISATGALNPTTNIPVSVLVSTNPLLIVSPGSVTFNSQPSSGVPQSQIVQLTSSTPASALSFSSTVTPQVAGGPVFATVSQSASTTPATLTIGILPSVLVGLAPGTYVDNVTLSSTNAGNPTITIPVTLMVANTSSLTVNPSTLVLNYEIGTGVVPPTQSITVASTGAPIQFTTTSTSNCNNFLSVFQTSGNTLSSTGQNGTPINASVNVNGLTTPTTCTGTITLTNTSNNSTVSVAVTLNVVSAAVIDVGANSISQTAPSGSTTPIQTIVALTATDNSTRISFTALGTTSVAGQTWLTVTPNTGNTPANLLVTLNPTNQSPGTYTGTITITDNTPASPVPTQNVPVTFVVAAQATSNPTSLTFTAALNAANPGNQTITVGGIPSTTTIAATASTLTCGSGWLSTTINGNTVIVTVNSASLNTTAPATCNGSVAIIVPGAANSPLNIPVSVNVLSTVLSLSATNATFSFVAGSGTTAPTSTVQLTTTNGASVNFIATASSTPAGLVTVTPTSGTTSATTPVTLTIGLSPTILASLGQGTYMGTVSISSANLAPVTINVSLSVTTPPPPNVTSVVNAATQQPGPLSPGEIITIYGTNLGPVTPVSLTLTASGKVSTALGNTQVFFDGIAAPLIYVSAMQINAIVPYDINGRFQTNMTTSINGATSSGLVLRVTDTSPGIFTLSQTGNGQGAILNQNGTVNGVNNPAPKTTIISVYGTGEGQINPPGSTGTVTTGVPPFPKPTGNVTLSFIVPGPNGTTTSVPATITYAGEAPSLVSGVIQVNAIIPSSIPSGANTIVLTVGANSSPSVVTVQVQ